MCSHVFHAACLIKLFHFSNFHLCKKSKFNTLEEQLNVEENVKKIIHFEGVFLTVGMFSIGIFVIYDTKLDFKGMTRSQAVSPKRRAITYSNQLWKLKYEINT